MIETADLLLRSGREDDWSDLHRNVWSRSEVFRYLFGKPCPDEDAARKKTAAYAGMHREVPTEFFVEEKGSGQVIGIAGVKELSPGCWTITDVAIGPEFQRRGYGRQIIGALISLAFEHGVAEIAYECFEGNTASARLAEACGFRFSHCAKAELQINGKDVMLRHYVLRK